MHQARNATHWPPRSEEQPRRSARHFIGVFDTVAALGNRVTSAPYTAAFLAFAAGLGIVGWVSSHFDETPLFGWLFAYLSFRNVFWGTIVAASLVAVAVYTFTHFKWAYEHFGDDWKKSLRTIHVNELWMRFYDYDLNLNVGCARHAISIDENRKNFKRVPWYSTKDTSRDEHGIQWFEQVWFAGNHSDIGGSFAENEARLSDITLDWMLKWATVVPGGLKHDDRVLKGVAVPRRNTTRRSTGRIRPNHQIDRPHLARTRAEATLARCSSAPQCVPAFRSEGSAGL